jgi:hypothetical protein
MGEWRCSYGYDTMYLSWSYSTIVVWLPFYTYSRCVAPPFLTSALDEAEWSASHRGRFTPGETDPGPQTRSGCYKEENKLLLLSEI